MFKYLVLFAGLALCDQYDPLKDFCRLFGHQTAVVGNEVYIDGGITEWSPITANSPNYTSTWLRRAALDENNQGFPQQYVMRKNSSVPSVVGGTLWPDSANKLVYLYGGEYGNGNPEPFKMWYYDIVYDTWNITNTTQPDVNRAAWGGSVTAEDRSQGFYYGGWLTKNTMPGYGDVQTALSTMLVYNMADSTFRNESGPDGIPRAEGALLYLPAGDGGLLVYFGGVEMPFGNSTMQGTSMTDIFVYSIGDNKWYKEKASGDVPDQRRRFCAGVVWSQDRSSYNIYLYGGASVGNGFGFADVYILSLPSFRWIKFYSPDDANWDGKTTKHSASCNVIGNSQMLIMGGFATQSSQCDLPPVYGQHGLDMGKNNPESAKWAVVNASSTVYKVPPEITKTIGGVATGGATLTSPTSGWANSVLQVDFSKSYTPTLQPATRALVVASATPTPEPVNHDNDGGAPHKKVVGAAVGGVFGGLIAIAALGYVARLSYRKRQQRLGKYGGTEKLANAQEREPQVYIELPVDMKAPVPSHSPDHYGSAQPNEYYPHYVPTLEPQELPATSAPVHARTRSKPYNHSPISPEPHNKSMWN